MMAERGPASALPLGAQPSWDPGHWSAIVAAKASLRAQLSRARNKGVTVRRSRGLRRSPACSAASTSGSSGAACRPCTSWSNGTSSPASSTAACTWPSAAAQTIGFLIASPIPLRNGWLIEQIVRGRAAPNGTTELLLDTAIRALAEDGAGYVTLGLSPLSRAVPQTPPPPWSIRPLLAWVRVHARRFYDFEGLERFKRKFLPESWEPIYAVTDRPRVSLRTLYAIAGAFGGTSPLLFLGHALLRALAQEARWAAGRARQIISPASSRI